MQNVIGIRESPERENFAQPKEKKVVQLERLHNELWSDNRRQSLATATSEAPSYLSLRD